jgi:anti-anti-sigma factor
VRTQPPERIAPVLGFPAGLCRCDVELSTRFGEQIAVLRVSGEVDACSLTMVSAVLDSCLALRPMHLVVDLSGLGFCSVPGMALLVHTSCVATSAGIGFSLAGCRTSPEHVLISIWEDQIPHRYRDVAEAIDAAITGRGMVSLDQQRRSRPRVGRSGRATSCPWLPR